MKNKYNVIWLLLSSFGIMFAVFSWIQESTCFMDDLLIGYRKGLLALLLGFFLYFFIAKKA
tara:strand:- start:551 stop:733 length:183 start_codon:yes stop_codon:yes gene_type:complete